MEDIFTGVRASYNAAIHLMGFARAINVKVLTNEAVAYLAGAIYVIASGQRLFNPNTSQPSSVAYVVASKKGIAAGSPGTTNAGSPIDFNAQELAPLLAAIQAFPFYKKNWNYDEEQRWVR